MLVGAAEELYVWLNLKLDVEQDSVSSRQTSEFWLVEPAESDSTHLVDYLTQIQWFECKLNRTIDSIGRKSLLALNKLYVAGSSHWTECISEDRIRAQERTKSPKQVMFVSKSVSGKLILCSKVIIYVCMYQLFDQIIHTSFLQHSDRIEKFLFTHNTLNLQFGEISQLDWKLILYRVIWVEL